MRDIITVTACICRKPFHFPWPDADSTGRAKHLDAGRIHGFRIREPRSGSVPVLKEPDLNTRGGIARGDAVSSDSAQGPALIPRPSHSPKKASTLVSPHLETAALDPSSSGGAVTKRIIAGFFLGLALLGIGGVGDAGAAPAKQSASISTTLAGPGAGAVKSPAVTGTGTVAEKRLDKNALIESMITKDSRIGEPTPAEVQALKKTLSKVDGHVLEYAKEHGTSFLVVHSGQNLMATGLIEEQQPAGVCDRALAQGGTAREALQSVERMYSARLEDVKAQLAKMNALPEEMGGPGPAAALSRASAEEAEKISDFYASLRSLQGDQRREMSARLEEKTGNLVKIFNAAEGMPIESSAFEGLALANRPLTLEEMAIVHGAATPEEIARFTSTTESLNGGKIETLRKEAVGKIEASLRSQRDPVKFRQQYQLLEQYRANPASIPIDHINNQILVPNLYHYRAGGRGVAVNLHDFSTLNNWNDSSGRIKPGSGRDGGRKGVMAQHIAKDGTNTIIIRSTALTDRSAIHELGHAIENILRTTSPGFSAELSAARDLAYSHLAEHKDGPYHPAITDYAAVSATENLAEGFSMYFTDAKLLKQKDPEMHSIIEKMASFIQSHHSAGGQR
jgi:hypothetical protein